MTTRRTFLRTSALAIPAAALSACSSLTPAQLSAAIQQMAADVNGALAGFSASFPTIAQTDPKDFPPALVSQVTALIASAQTADQALVAAVSSVTTSSATVATTADQVMSYLTMAFNVIKTELPIAAAAFPTLAPYVLPIEAGIALVQTIEGVIAANFPTGSTPVSAATAAILAPVPAKLAARRGARTTLTPDDARTILGVKTV